MEKVPTPTTACKCETENLTTKEAADFLRKSHRWLETMRSEGTGPRYYKLGDGPKAGVIYLRSDLREWRDRGAVVPQRETEPERTTDSSDPRHISKERLERALQTAAKMVAGGAPTGPFEAIEKALAVHTEDDVRARALKLVARKKAEEAQRDSS